MSAHVRERGAVLGRGEPADARRPALHAADLRPGLEQPERADAHCALGFPGRRLRLPGSARSDPLARRGAVRRGARPAPGAGSAWRDDPHRRRQPPSRRRAAAGPRPRPDPRISDRRGPDRHRRPALGAGVPDHLFPHSSLARRGLAGGRRHPVHHDAADRARQPGPGQGGRAGRGPAPDHGRGATPQRRDHHGDGNVWRAGAALGRGQ